MSVRQVQAVILAKFKVSKSSNNLPLRQTWTCERTPNPDEIETCRLLLAVAYRFLCQAYLSLVPINQMNVFAGDNTRKVMILMLVKTLYIGTIETTWLLNHIVCNTATNINAEN
jgi:hypothetical protein